MIKKITFTYKKNFTETEYAYKMPNGNYLASNGFVLLPKDTPIYKLTIEDTDVPPEVEKLFNEIYAIYLKKIELEKEKDNLDIRTRELSYILSKIPVS